MAVETIALTELPRMQLQTMPQQTTSLFFGGSMWNPSIEPPPPPVDSRRVQAAGRKQRNQLESRPNGGVSKPQRRRGHGRRGASHWKRRSVPPAAPRNTNTSLLRAHGVPPTTGVSGKCSPPHDQGHNGERKASEAELAGIGDPYGSNLGLVTRDEMQERLSIDFDGLMGTDEEEASTQCSGEAGGACNHAGADEEAVERHNGITGCCAEEDDGESERDEYHMRYLHKLRDDNRTLRQRVKELEAELQRTEESPRRSAAES